MGVACLRSRVDTVPVVRSLAKQPSPTHYPQTRAVRSAAQQPGILPEFEPITRKFGVENTKALQTSRALVLEQLKKLTTAQHLPTVSVPVETRRQAKRHPHHYR